MTFLAKPLSEEQNQRLMEIMADEKRCGLTMEAIADLFFISTTTLYKKLRQKQIQDGIKLLRESSVKIHLPAVDAALVRKALSGDVRAISLCYQRFEGWSPSLGLPASEASEDSEARRARVLEYLASLKQQASELAEQRASERAAKLEQLSVREAELAEPSEALPASEASFDINQVGRTPIPQSETIPGRAPENFEDVHDQNEAAPPKEEQQ